MPSLIVENPEIEPKKFELLEKELSIGAEKDNAIVVPSPNVSTYHAELTWVDGDYKIKDLNSTNGTYLNGEKIEKGVLRNGDQLQIADVVFRYESDINPADTEKLAKLEVRAKEDKPWKVKKSARKTSKFNKLLEENLQPDKLVGLPPPPLPDELEAVQSPRAKVKTFMSALAMFVVAFSFGGLIFFLMKFFYV